MRRVVFLGSKRLGLQILSSMYEISAKSICCIVTIDDSQDYRSELEQFKNFASCHAIPLEVLTRSKDLDQVISRYQPEVCIVSGWYWILKPHTLSMVPGGFIGLHASLLPKYRGGAPLVWALINGEKEAGVSLFYFDEGTDTGDILAQCRIEIKEDDYIGDLLYKLESCSLELVQREYPLILEGQSSRKAQLETGCSHYPMRKPEDGHIDWGWSADRIYNFIRAQSRPYPGAFATIAANTHLIVWRARIHPDTSKQQAGEVLVVNNRYLEVCCGDGRILSLDDVEVKGQPGIEPIDVVKGGDVLY